CRLVHCSARHDFIAYFQRHAAPTRSASFHIGAIDKIADADNRADSVIGKTLQMIDQVLAREHLLRHPAVRDVLVAEMAVQIDQRRHYGLAGEIDACTDSWDSDLTFAS